ncbi:tricarballylate utilization LysR family transcriptional regulator TcuR [Salmonella enterica subsp. enterica serovar Pasing]|nr:tricarballylate utilization LysR family transcriptional regulator TcuR [Salmonella enterica subsp. enterica serovar Pasing]EHI7333996.1 tricarballylate utilization LysR family transcriptional regulator TcuR [Salmonella enterica]
MELRQLRYFVRIIETGSMGSAAQDLDIGVSALSQQMSRLENELAIRLLQRTSRGVTPTNAGLAFYSQAQLALRHADDAILAAREARLSGHVSVGMAPSTASILGIPFIHAMQENYADVRLHVVESLSGNLERMINTRQIDLAVVFQKDKILRWSARPILEEQLFLIGSHALLAALPDNPITPEQLAGIPLIMPSQGHGLRGRLDAVCQEHALNVEIVAEIDGLALLMRAVRDGLGATLQPGAAISHLDNDALRVIGVHNPVLSRPNFLVSLSDDELTPAGLAARVVLTKVMRQLVDAGEWPGATL